jgi:hypothetical protein
MHIHHNLHRGPEVFLRENATVVWVKQSAHRPHILGAPKTLEQAKQHLLKFQEVQKQFDWLYVIFLNKGRWNKDKNISQAPPQLLLFTGSSDALAASVTAGEARGRSWCW